MQQDHRENTSMDNEAKDARRIDIKTAKKEES
jgi:hypothetical protein